MGWTLSNIELIQIEIQENRYIEINRLKIMQSKDWKRWNESWYWNKDFEYWNKEKGKNYTFLFCMNSKTVASFVFKSI